MGRVYLAQDDALERQVAIKLIASARSSDADARHRFLQEARAMATVEHPHVVRVYAYGESEGQAYFVMEYVEGETLGQRLLRKPRATVEASLALARQAGEGLAAAWKRGIVHRDVKPSNILVDGDDRAKVADFGLARAVSVRDAAVTRAGALVGTVHYMSPEQAQGGSVDFRSDIYSLGIVLYEMLAGRRPFEGRSPSEVIAAHLRDPLPPLRSARDDVPDGVAQIVSWMTQKEPASRPHSYPALLSSLAQGARDSGRLSTVSTMTSLPAPSRWDRGLRKALWTGLFVILLAIAAFWWHRRLAPAVTEGAFVVAVAPFYGPDEESAHEGRVMSSLVESDLTRRLAPDEATVLGQEEIEKAVHTPQAARALGSRLGATAVVWGQVLALRGQVEIDTRVTTLSGPTAANEASTGGSVTFDAAAPNPIELRRNLAAAVFETISLLAARHALMAEGRAAKALAILDRIPRSSEALKCRAEALRRLGNTKEAQAVEDARSQLTPSTAAP
jgi:predicted Ser/Thr protein kinase